MVLIPSWLLEPFAFVSASARFHPKSSGDRTALQVACPRAIRRHVEPLPPVVDLPEGDLGFRMFPWVAGTPNFGSSGPRSLARLHRLPPIASAPFCQCL